MKRMIAAFLAVLLFLAAPGCSNTPPAMETKTYALPLGDTSWKAITMVLQDEWRGHNVMSNAERRDDGAAVRTTARGHRKIAAALKPR